MSLRGSAMTWLVMIQELSSEHPIHSRPEGILVLQVTLCIGCWPSERTLYTLLLDKSLANLTIIACKMSQNLKAEECMLPNRTLAILILILPHQCEVRGCLSKEYGMFVRSNVAQSHKHCIHKHICLYSWVLWGKQGTTDKAWNNKVFNHFQTCIQTCMYSKNCTKPWP